MHSAENTMQRTLTKSGHIKGNIMPKTPSIYVKIKEDGKRRTPKKSGIFEETGKKISEKVGAYFTGSIVSGIMRTSCVMTGNGEKETAKKSEKAVAAITTIIEHVPKKARPCVAPACLTVKEPSRRPMSSSSISLSKGNAGGVEKVLVMIITLITAFPLPKTVQIIPKIFAFRAPSAIEERAQRCHGSLMDDCYSAGTDSATTAATRATRRTARPSLRRVTNGDLLRRLADGVYHRGE